jgi:hypothetical protein
MNKRIVILSVILALALSTLACGVNFNGSSFRSVRGSGVVVSEDREVSDFNSVDLAGIGNLYIEFGAEEALTIEAEDNFMEYIEVDVFGKMLEIKFQSGKNLQPTVSINYYLTVVELDSIEVSGLGSVKLPELDVTDFFIDISGGGDVGIEQLDAKFLEVDISGLGNLSIDDGYVVRQEISISGGGNYKARRLESEEAYVNISGLGNTTIRVSDMLDVHISGGGNVEYFGSPDVTSDVSGLGNIDKLGD